MIRYKLINCDFLNNSAFMDNLSNKAKLLYYEFIANSDDLGFVANGSSLANQLDSCSQNYENVLFAYKFTDAIHELVERGYVYDFTDRHNNHIYLIRHYFKHNKNKDFLFTTFTSYYDRVELVNGEYILKNHKREQEKKPFKEKENKENESKAKQNNTNLKETEKDKESENWVDLLKDLDS